MNKLVKKVGDMTIVTAHVASRPGNYLTLVLRGDVLWDLAGCEGGDEDAAKQHEAYALMAELFGPVSEAITNGEVTTGEEALAMLEAREARVLGKPTLLH